MVHGAVRPRLAADLVHVDLSGADSRRGTLQRLARYQGTKVDAASEEQPGRILHEARARCQLPTNPRRRHVYYGTADATPLFVVLLGELHRWGVAPTAVTHCCRPQTVRWSGCGRYGDRDGDGFVEYERASEHGLVNQGWKDSYDGISFADGRLASAPIALCEVQGYVYAAYIARSEIADDAGDVFAAELWGSRAAELKAAFNERFWLPDRGYFAVGLDRDKQPIDSLTSNIGHCLWSGIVSDDHAASVIAHLMSPEMFTGWGVRTLASSMARYNPMSYHNGSVWPHDNALVAAGLMRYGFVAEAQRVAGGSSMQRRPSRGGCLSCSVASRVTTTRRRCRIPRRARRRRGQRLHRCSFCVRCCAWIRTFRGGPSPGAVMAIAVRTARDRQTAPRRPASFAARRRCVGVTARNRRPDRHRRRESRAGPRRTLPGLTTPVPQSRIWLRVSPIAASSGGDVLEPPRAFTTATTTRPTSSSGLAAEVGALLLALSDDADLTSMRACRAEPRSRGAHGLGQTTHRIDSGRELDCTDNASDKQSRPAFVAVACCRICREA